MSDLALDRSAKLDIGRVIGETFGVIRRHFVTFAGLSFLLGGLPTAIISILQAGAIKGDVVNFSAERVFATVMGVLFGVVFTSILQGALIYATVQDLNGAKPTIGASLATGFRSFLPLLGTSILLTLAIVGASILLIVPGIMLGCAWCVALPALIADRTGVTGAFSRSVELTRNNRWRIFGLFLIIWVGLMVLGIGVAAVTMGGVFMGGDPRTVMANPLTVVGNAIVNTLTYMIFSSGVAVLYVELRKIRDGHGGQWLSEIFG